MKIGLLLCITAMAVVVISSNILVQFLLGDWLTYGAFTYPFAFLINDLTNRFYGVSAARRVILNGFVVGLFCSFLGTQITGEFGPLVTLRIAIGSGTAFLAAQFLDALIFDRLRAGKWWRAPLASSIVGSSLDTAIFFTFAFSACLNFIEPSNNTAWANEYRPLLGFGHEFPLWISLGVADFVVKLGLALGALIPFRVVIGRFSTP